MGHIRYQRPTSDQHLLHDKTNPSTMNVNIAILFLSIAVAFAHPIPEEVEQAAQEEALIEEADAVELLRLDVVQPNEEGSHSMDFVADNGISFQLSGRQGDNGGANMVGTYTYLVDGEAVPLTFVANENGYQPESSLLPVAPAFPHEIPEWVLEQIAFAEQERSLQAQTEQVEE